MRLFYLVRIKESDTVCCGAKFANRTLLLTFTMVQLAILMGSFAQHLYSMWRWRHIFHCRSDIGADAAIEEKLLAYDLVIYDFGLMHKILGTTECVANYLDGGYMRCLYCLEHATALGLLLFFLWRHQLGPLWIVWPALLMQSSYSLGLTILTMAIAPKILEALGGGLDGELGFSLGIYLLGYTLNWLFTFILWYYYWGVERVLSPPPQQQSIRAFMRFYGAHHIPHMRS